MASMFRKIIRNAARKFGRRENLAGNTGAGAGRMVRAGMHQAGEHEFRRSQLADGVPVPETPENALDMPGALAAEIPPVEEDDDEIVEEIAEGEAEVAPEAEILEETADPDAAENEELEAEPKVISDQMSVDYSGERIPVIEPVTGGTGVPADTPLEYKPGDGTVKEVQEPLPGLGEKFGVLPLFDGIENPSANVPAMPEEPAEPEEPVEPVEQVEPVEPAE